MSNPLFGNGGTGQNNMFGPFGGMMNFMNNTGGNYGILDQCYNK